MYREWDVEPYPPIPNAADKAIQNLTYLFRADSDLPSALALAIDSYKADKGEPFTVLSVGCSTGAEADSVLAIVETDYPELGKICLRGIDNDGDAIDRANNAKHVIVGSEAGSEKGLRRLLPDALSDLSLAADGGDSAYVVLDTSGLRARHEVAFEQMDLTVDSFDLPKADLVVCNNVLYYLLRDDVAFHLLYMMTKQLKPSAVLGMEAGSVEQISGLEPPVMASDYSFWRYGITEYLTDQLFKPMLYAKGSRVAVAFRAPSTA